MSTSCTVYRMTTAAAPTGRFTGKCPKCLTVHTLVDAPAWHTWTRTCSCGTRVALKAVIARTTEHKCGVKCTSALGPKCDCECGGEHHGRDLWAA